MPSPILETTGRMQSIRERLAAHTKDGYLIMQMPTADVEFLVSIVDYKPAEGELPNARHGQRHIHSGQYECGQAWREDPRDPHADPAWHRCAKAVNHEGECGPGDISAF